MQVWVLGMASTSLDPRPSDLCILMEGVLPSGYSTWPRALWNDVMVKEGISMETPTIMGSIEISRTRPYSSKNKM